MKPIPPEKVKRLKSPTKAQKRKIAKLFREYYRLDELALKARKKHDDYVRKILLQQL